MKVIVAGMTKTGTKSVNAALKKLGYSVYDYPENAYLLTDEYNKIALKGWETKDFRKMYENVDAVVDYPAFVFWDEIHKAFPEAKIILMMRKSEDEWLRSLEKQIQLNDKSTFFKLMSLLSPTARKADIFHRVLGPITLGNRPKSILGCKSQFNKQMAKKMYRQHNAYVLHTAPKEKLLVYSCSDGWEPLCEFLGVPVPDEPFPHRNKGGNIHETLVDDFPIFRRIQREILVSSIFITATSVLAGIVFYKYGFSTIFRRAGTLSYEFVH